MRKVISIENGIARMEKWRMASPVNFDLLEGENVAVMGDNGSGKSFFVDILMGRHPLLGDAISYDFLTSDKEYSTENIKYICFKDSYGGDNDSTYYLQQRWNQTEISSSTATVADRLDAAYKASGEDTPSRQAVRQHIYKLFGLDRMLDKYVVLLSSGELRKLILTCAIFASPQLLIIDNPYIGLDATARQQLTSLLALLSGHYNIQVMLVVNRKDDIPDFITHVVEVKNMAVGPKTPANDFLKDTCVNNATPQAEDDRKARGWLHDTRRRISETACDDAKHDSRDVIKMNDVSIKYGNHTILSNLSWTVHSGEHWAVTGSNGSGKSTLLSLICADNPQSYACDITLFDRQRGSGESIWDIKRHIGYVSPELHRAFRTNVSVEKVVASGFSNAIGIYSTPDADKLNTSIAWMEIFGIDHLQGRSFLQISSGEQRLALLARAMVKAPGLLVLDEPFHGLDTTNRQRVRDIIDMYCAKPGKTLIMVSHYVDEFPSCIDHQLMLSHN